MRATGRAGVRRGARAAARRARRGRRVSRALGIPCVSAGAARGAVSRAAARARRARRHPRRPALPHDVVGRAGERRGDGAAPRATAATSTSRSATTRRRWARSAGSTADDVRRQGEEIAAANEALAPFRVLRGIECDILADGRLDLPDDVLAELDWVQASVHGGQRMPRREMTRAGRGGAAATRTCAASATRRAGYINRRPENALDLERVFEVALEHGVALEVNGLPPASTCSGEHVRDALRAGVRDRLLDRRALDPRAWRTWSSPSRRPGAAGRPRRTSSTRGRSARSSTAGPPRPRASVRREPFARPRPARAPGW